MSEVRKKERLKEAAALLLLILLLTAAGLKTALSAFPPGPRTHRAVQRERPLQMNRCFRLNTFPAQVQEKPPPVL